MRLKRTKAATVSRVQSGGPWVHEWVIFHFARVAGPDAERFAKPGTAPPTRRV